MSFLAVGLQRGERPFLVDAHEARVSHHVRGKDRGEPARGTGLFVHSPTLRVGGIILAAATLIVP